VLNIKEGKDEKFIFGHIENVEKIVFSSDSSILASSG
jgi:hypothetical protein